MTFAASQVDLAIPRAPLASSSSFASVTGGYGTRMDSVYVTGTSYFAGVEFYQWILGYGISTWFGK